MLRFQKANPATTSGAYQNKEDLPWIEETLRANSEKQHNLWEELYQTIQEGKEYFISPERAAEVMKIIFEAKKGTEF